MNTVANTLRRLAPCTSLRQYAHRAQNSSMATLNRILKSPHRSGAAGGSPLSILNDEKPAHRITHRKSKSYSISIIPVRITATATPAASFLPPNRKRLANTPHLLAAVLRESFPM